MSVFAQGGRGGKLYATAENCVPEEINSQTLESVRDWHLDEAWGRPLTSHPKRALGSGELVVMGVSAEKPFLVVGVISADGKQLVHKADANLSRSIITHDIGVTERYNVLIDHPLTLNARRIFEGGKLLKYEKDVYTRIEVMPRYSDPTSIRWFDVETNCILHILICFEDGDEVVMRGCRARVGIIAGPENYRDDIHDWYSRGFKHVNAERSGDADCSYLFHRVHEWRLDMVTGQVKEGYVSGTDFSMDFPIINENFTGLRHKYSYTQVVDSDGSSKAGLCKYGGLAKLYFDEPSSDQISIGIDGRQAGRSNSTIKMEYHGLGKNNFYSGSMFVPKPGDGNEEDDGWIVSFVHNDDTDASQVHVIDAKNFKGEPVTKINLPQSVPYGFHATFAEKHSFNIM